MKFIINRLSIKELVDLKRFHVKCFCSYIISDISFVNYFTMPQYIVMAAIDVRGVILGYAICSALFDEIDIIFLGVALENRCCGIASQILNKIVNSMPALKRIYLEVDINNIGAMTFYRKKGFEIIRIRKMYANGRDAYEMMKKIYDIDL